MKKVIKTQGILFNVEKVYKTTADHPKNPKYAVVSYHIGNKTTTSKNKIAVSWDSKEGDRMTIYYAETNPHKVFKYAWTARLFG